MLTHPFRAALTLTLLLPALAPAKPSADDLADARQQMVDDLAHLRFDRLGDRQRGGGALRWDHIPPVYAPEEKPHRLLVVLVEYPDKKFDRFAGEPGQGDKLRGFYQDLLFDPAYAKPNTLSHYYATQSLGTYHLQGTVLPPITLSKPRGAYGAPYRPEGGDWRNDADSEGMVEEALKLAVAAHPDLDWGAFDRWDPLDHDGDDLLGEADGYLDHFVLVYAGGGQSSCQGLYKLGEKLNPNVGPEALAKLSDKERECAERMWPHRFLIQKRERQGPRVEGRVNARGGAPLLSGEGEQLWVLDYNMQSEYTEPSTFIHEFGHSIGLPDVYARQSSNSTGGWSVMSSTSDPVAQNMTAWSRLMLGWLRPRIVLPPEFGGEKVQSAYLRTLDDPLDPPAKAAANQAAGLWRAALVVLPPKTREIELTALPKGSRWGLYSGQGNELNRSAEIRADLSKVKGPIELSFDAWWDIEAGWDFAYLETSADGGRTWQRRLPKNRKHMPAKHGHDGKDTVPGFTGLSGDLDGDGKNESRKACDPKKKLAHGEDKAGKKKSPCQIPSWVRPAFDLSDLAGAADARIRLRYFTDMAAVMRGILIDDVKLTGAGIREDFEDRPGSAWRLDGFVRSEGAHTLLVPHYYLLEHRDPYAAAGEDGQFRYDSGLTDASYRFFWDVAQKKLRAMRVRPRPGVVAWYYDGAYAWSENEPVDNGQGRGFLLALDSTPNELPIPGLEPWYAGDAAQYDTRYEVKSEAAQAALRDAYVETMCFVRDAGYRPTDLDPALVARCAAEAAPAAAVKVLGKPLMYSYRIINELLPGAARDAVETASELYDYKQRKGKTTWRLRDRSLRYLHTLDAPFALEPFPEAVEVFDVVDGKLVRAETRPHPAVPAFSDADPKRWANPNLYFGGVSVPEAGFRFELAEPKPSAPAPAQYKVWFLWDR